MQVGTQNKTNIIYKLSDKCIVMDMTRPIDETHPFLSFQPQLSNNPRLWSLLGEVKSKCEHIAGAPLLPSVSRELHQVYLAKGIMATTAIEGNTLTEAQVRAILDKTIHVPPSREYQRQEVENVITACNEVLESVFNDPNRPLTLQELCGFNAHILYKLELAQEVTPGQLRPNNVSVGRYLAPQAADVPELMHQFIRWLNTFDLGAGGEQMRPHYAILRAILAHLYFVWIHPFGDGNGRVSRLLELYLLLKAGVSTPVAHLLSNHYNLTRDRYYLELDRAQRNIEGFVLYALEGFRDGLAEQIAQLQVQQSEVMWGYLVDSAIEGTSESAVRQRTLARELAHPAVLARGVSKEEIPRLNFALMASYGSRTPKTLSRDLNTLLEKELILTVPGKETRYRAQWKRLLGMLPARIPPPSRPSS